MQYQSPVISWTSRLLCASALVATSFVPLTAQTKPDNTGVNTRDRAGASVTSDHQPNNKSDLETTRQLRRAIVADKSLSTYAHNVKIVTQSGKVTLKGPVRSDKEKEAVEAKAAEVAGVSNVTSGISIAPATTSKSKSKHS